MFYGVSGLIPRRWFPPTVFISATAPGREHKVVAAFEGSPRAHFDGSGSRDLGGSGLRSYPMAKPQEPFYEIRCQRCDVSFPPETKVCMHCGERIRPQSQVLTSSSSLEEALMNVLPSDVRERAQREYEPQPSVEKVSAESNFGEVDTPHEAEGTEEPRFSKSKLLGNLVWIVLAILASAFQVCRGG